MKSPPRCATLWALLLALACPACQGPSPTRGASSGLARVDLTARPWFPPIVPQEGFSCAQQVGLYYLLSAERNRPRGPSAPREPLSPYQAYAILAESTVGGTHLTDGWILARETGVPLASDRPHGGRALMHGFAKYVRALHQRPADYEILPLRREADLVAVKDRLASGQLVACTFQVRGAKVLPHPPDGRLVTAWGRLGPGHSMVYAGYDEAIGYDCNRDGRLTNDRDITGDGQVTLADHEKGAFLVVNPWGPRWGQGGKAWALWREHALNPWPPAGEVATVRAAPETSPRLLLRLSLHLHERRGLVLSASDGTRHLEPLPFRSQSLPRSSPGSAGEAFGKMHRTGPKISSGPLANPSGGPLEMGLDVSALRGPRFQLRLATVGPPLLGTLQAASFVELDPSGRSLRETPVLGLPAALPAAGGTWSTAP